MRNSWLCLLLVVLVGCGSKKSSSPVSLSGRALLKGQADSSGIVVTATGPTTQTTKTASNGSYSFIGLLVGTYAVTATAKSTAEITLTTTVVVPASGGAVAPDLTFSPLGGINGKVSLADAASPQGIAVAISGRSLFTLTDAQGNFEIDGVPAGDVTVSASLAGYAAASETVHVSYASVATAGPLVLSRSNGVGSISGTISLTGSSAAGGVTITVSGPSSAVVQTQSDGRWTATGLDDGTYAVTAAAPSTAESVQTEQVTVANGGAATAGTLTFTALGKVSGTATLGSATGNAGIVVLASGTSASAVTDDSGHFTLANVPAGNQNIVASYPGYTSATTAVAVGWNQDNAASALTLARTTALGAIDGTAVLTGLSSSAGIAVTLTGPVSGAALTDASGAYAFTGLPDGTYSITAAAPSTSEHSLTVTATIASGATVQPAAISLTPLGSISGIANLNGAASGNAGITILVAGTSAQSTTDDSGQFTIRSVPAGQQSIIASYPGYQSANASVTVSWNATIQSTTLSLSQALSTGAISGSAILSGEVSNAGVAITLAGPTSGAAVSASDGSFAFQNLPNGAYSLTAVASDTLEGSQTASVSLTDGGTATAPTFTFTPTGSISGVATLNGAASGNGGITVAVSGSSAFAVTDDSGHYLITRVPTGTHDLTASLSGWSTASASGVAVTRGQTASAPELDLTQNGSATPVITFGSVSPNPARAGDTLTITFSANEPLDACAASVEGQNATCASPSGASCTCTFDVLSSTVEGSALVLVSGTASNATGSASSSVDIDQRAPIVDLSKVHIIRNAMGVADQLSADPGAFVDDAPNYAGQTVPTLKVTDASGTTLLTLAPNADGSLTATDLPGSDGTNGPAPQTVYVSAIDVPGNASSAVAVTNGADFTGPSGNASFAAITRRDLTAQDGVSGLGGVLSDATSALASVKIFDSSWNLITEVPVAADGSFSEVLIGTDTDSFPYVHLEGVDKCGNVGADFIPGTGSELSVPTGDGSKLTVTRRDLTQADGVSGAASAFTAVCTMRDVILGSSSGATDLGSGTFNSDGSFGELTVGSATSSSPHVYVHGVDKCNQQSAWVLAQNGDDASNPSLTMSDVTIVRHDLTAADGVVATAGAITSTCAPRNVTIAPSGLSTVSGTAASDGSFAELDFGTATSSAATVSLTADDKCGRSSTASISNGAETSNPTLTMADVTIMRHDLTTADGVVATAGAIASTCAPRNVNIYPGGGTSGSGSGKANMDGSFAEISFDTATQSAASVLLSVDDKCGKSSSSYISNGAETSNPTLDLSKVTIVRHDTTQPDGVSATAGAIASTCAPRSVKLYPASHSTVTGTANSDGSITELAFGSNTSSAGSVQIWVDDKCGNSYGTPQITNGQVTAAATGDGSKMSFARNALGTPDSVSGLAGAFTGGCFPSTINITTTGGTSVANGSGNSDGSFNAISVGSGTSSYGSLRAQDVDKCGFSSAWATIQGNTDSAAPVINGTLITLEAQSPGTSDTVSGAPGAITDAVSAIREVDIYSKPDAGGFLSSFVPDDDGGFPSQAVSLSNDKVYFGATDKCGFTSSLVNAKSIHAIFDLSGHTAHDGVSALWTVADTSDPRDGGPGELLAWGHEASDESGAAAVDSSRAVAQSSPTSGGDGGWNVLDLPVYIGSGLASTFDTSRGVPVIAGTFAGVSGTSGETLEWSGAWTRIDAPPPSTVPYYFGGTFSLQHGTAIFDSVRGKVVALTSANSENYYSAFGGWGYYCYLTEYDGTSWTAATAAPIASCYSTNLPGMAYDSVRQKVVVFGGYGANYPYYSNQTWEYDGTTWTQITTAHAPSARYNARMGFDPVRNQVVLFGGQGSSTLRDTWTYDGTDWTQQSPVDAPGQRYGGSALAWDGTGLVLAGGGGVDIWRWDGTDWSQINTGFRSDIVAFGYDTANSRYVAVDSRDVAWTSSDAASFTQQTPSMPVSGANLTYNSRLGELMLARDNTLGTSWLLTDGGWQQLSSESPYSSVVFDDALRGVTIASDGNAADLAEFDGTSWKTVSTVHRPTMSSSTSLALDSTRGVLLKFGGYGYTSQLGYHYDNETWQYDGSDWTQLFPTTSPSARASSMMVYDPHREVTVLFGGTDSNGTLYDTWEFDGTTWTRKTPTGAPNGTGPAYYDPARQAVCMIYGNALYEYSGGNWTETETTLFNSPSSVAFDPGYGAPAFWNNQVAYLDRRVAGPTYAAHGYELAFDPGTTFSSLSATYVGAASGDDGSGTSAPGVDVLAWRGGTRAWVDLGSNSALDTDSILARTIQGTLATDYMANGKIWLLAVAQNPSSASGGAGISSTVSTDYLQVDATYTLP